MAEVKEAAKICYNWSHRCEEANLILSFKGDFNQDLINSILFLAEDKQRLSADATAVRNRIFSIMVESLQNICKHGVASGATHEIKPGIFLMGKSDGRYIISTGNLISNTEVDSLRDKIESVKDMNKQELKELHKKTLVSTTLSEKSGAGLGMIGMARKSDQLEYEFKKLDDKVSFFSFQAVVSTNQI